MSNTAVEALAELVAMQDELGKAYHSTPGEYPFSDMVKLKERCNAAWAAARAALSTPPVKEGREPVPEPSVRRALVFLRDKASQEVQGDDYSNQDAAYLAGIEAALHEFDVASAAPVAEASAGVPSGPEKTVNFPIIGAVPERLKDNEGLQLLERLVEGIEVFKDGKRVLAVWDHMTMFDLRDYICDAAPKERRDGR